MAEEEKGNVEVSEEMEKFISYVENLSVLELSEMVKALEERLGVSAAAPAAAVAAAPAGDAGQAAGAEEEQTEFDVMLNSVGEQKIGVIKEVRSIAGLGLKEAKALVEELPKAVKEGATKDEADKIKEQLENAGATVELK